MVIKLYFCYNSSIPLPLTDDATRPQIQPVLVDDIQLTVSTGIYTVEDFSALIGNFAFTSDNEKSTPKGNMPFR